MTARVDERRLEGLLKALWFGQAWAEGWRPGNSAPMNDLVRLALHRVRVGLQDELEDLTKDLLAPLEVAPLWLSSFPRPGLRALGAEPLPTVLAALHHLERYPREVPLHPSLYPGSFLGRAPKPRPKLLAVHAAVLRAVEPFTGGEARADLADSQGRVRRMPRLAPWFERNQIHVELVLALHAFEEGARMLSSVLKQLDEAGAPKLTYPLAALCCEAHTPGCVPRSWVMELHPADVGLLDAVCLGRSDEGRARLAAPRERRTP